MGNHNVHDSKNKNTRIVNDIKCKIINIENKKPVTQKLLVMLENTKLKCKLNVIIHIR